MSGKERREKRTIKWNLPSKKEDLIVRSWKEVL